VNFVHFVSGGEKVDVMDEETLNKMSPAEKQQVMAQVQQQVALAQMQELLTKVTDKCFKKCVSSPGTSLGSGEQGCLAKCMDRYMDSFNLVSKSYTQRLQREQQRM